MSGLRPLARFTAWAAIIAYPAILILRWGGKGQWTTQAAAAVALVGLVAAVASQRDRLRLPPGGWLLWLQLPLLVIGLIHVLPLGWGHPSTAVDRAASGSSAATWAVDGDAAIDALAWRCSLLVWCLSWIALRRIPAGRLIAIAVIAAAAHAIAAMLLAAIAPEFPLDNGYRGRVRGSFTYPNHAAAFWVTTLPLALLWARTCAARGRYAAWLAPAALGLAIVLSASRGGLIIGALVAAATILPGLPRRRLWVAGPVIAVVTFALWLLNPEQTLRRVGELAGDDAVTLGDRVGIWRAALPLVADAGPLGYGARSVAQLWRSAGSPEFEPHAVRHLHCDALELVACYGWIGAALLVLVAAVALRSLAAAWRRRPDGHLSGPLLGMAALLAYGLIDFPWQSEALVAWWLLLGGIAVAASAERDALAIRSVWPWRGAALAAAALLVAVAPVDWRREREAVRAWWAELAVRRSGWTGAEPVPPAIADALAIDASTARLGVVQARLALELDPPDTERAQGALAVAAHRCPVDPGAWLLRLRLARQRDDAQAATAAAGRLRHRGGAWPAAQRELLAAWNRGVIPRATAAAVAETMLAAPQARTRDEFDAIAVLLGRDRLLATLASSEVAPELRASALPWASTWGELDVWRTIWGHDWAARAGRLCPPEQRLAAEAALGAPVAPDRLYAPRARRQWLSEAVALARAGLPGPARPADRSFADEADAIAAWGTRLDQAAVDQLVALASRYADRPWAATWGAELAAVGRALGGDPGAVSRDQRPDHLDLIADFAPEQVAARAERLLATWRAPRWRQVGAVRWTWWQHRTPAAPVLVRSRGWVLVVVDGRAATWARGDIDLRLHVPEGLHRVAIVPPP